ncbi:PCMD domain-containing protein [Bacteroides caecigallinarum]|uniref:PCMD domain-containing protein n=1 Tax=Bacteroides caecigallinarum TaxID=1411144 RepID=UPI001F43F233|nr:PCMD domain-containing protein [Bacteroides caecigallinarum]MCF2581958.1 PCMD domain-containing protein [Bacteroides caecigallinarum]
MLNKVLYFIFSVFFFYSCAIENDIPYPISEGYITDIEVEGQTAAQGSSDSKAIIDKTKRTVSIVVDDAVDITKLRITKLTVSNDAVISIDSTVCNNYSKFPTSGFETLDDLMVSADTRVNFSSPVKLTLKTYQDYEWTINVQQYIERNIVVENQIGNAIIDEINFNVIIYVAEEQDLSKIKVTTFDLAGKNGSVYPDPTKDEYFDFSEPKTFFATYAWEEVSRKWTVYVYHSDGAGSSELNTFARTTSADISGSVQSGKKPVIEIKKNSESDWTTVSQSDVNVSGTSFSATVSQLSPDTQYDIKVSVDGKEMSSASFDTTPATPLENGSLDNWHNVDKLWNPWEEGGQSFWDTGNKGATTISDSNSIPTDETCNGSGKAASLESKYLVLKFAAGNLFTGSYVKTVGTNGVLSFGRPFSAFPSKLRFNYKYTSNTIDKVGDDAFQYLKGRPDSCHIYIALTDWDEPLEIRTRPAERQLFDKNDSKVIAYGEYIQGSTTSSYQQKDIILNYKYNNRTPKYIVVVASASKYGDYFTGGEGSKLWLDEMELVYE